MSTYIHDAWTVKNLEIRGSAFAMTLCMIIQPTSAHIVILGVPIWDLTTKSHRNIILVYMHNQVMRRSNILSAELANLTNLCILNGFVFNIHGYT